MQPDWHVLLIGGSSCSGKTTLAESLAYRLHARYIDLDLFWIVLRRATSPEASPDLHLFDDDAIYGRHDPGELVEMYQRVSRVVCDAVEPVLAHHDIIGRRVIIEGCWLLPDFAAQERYAGRSLDRPVRSLFIHEPSLEAMENRMRERSGGWIEAQSPESRQNHVQMQWQFGEALKERAAEFGLPVLESAPFESLETRALQVLSS
jgi:2-phosphoglycerate kinase